MSLANDGLNWFSPYWMGVGQSSGLLVTLFQILKISGEICVELRATRRNSGTLSATGRAAYRQPLRTASLHDRRSCSRHGRSRPSLRDANANANANTGKEGESKELHVCNQHNLTSLCPAAVLLRKRARRGRGKGKKCTICRDRDKCSINVITTLHTSKQNKGCVRLIKREFTSRPRLGTTQQETDKSLTNAFSSAFLSTSLCKRTVTTRSVGTKLLSTSRARTFRLRRFCTPRVKETQHECVSLTTI